MYTDEDLNKAVTKGIFTPEAVDAFREDIATTKSIPHTSEENFRLLSGFNDIFVVIACILSLVSASWAGLAVSETFSMALMPILAWLFAEYFVRKKKMALPAIVLLLFFVGGVFSFSRALFSGLDTTALPLAAFITTIATYLHWRRFMVPITIAAGMGAAAACFILSVLYIGKASVDGNMILMTIFIAGITTFTCAMIWDGRDLSRTTRSSDIAFWLHLLAAPMIVHPVFSKLGVFTGGESAGGMIVIVALYLLMTAISLIIDRRAFMVSSLIYVLYALSSLFENYGLVSNSFALTGLCIGCALLLLSAFWQKSRRVLLILLPPQIQKRVPQIRD